jgi:multidrug efflux pump subunit AcrA (membrane-fusion protein)
MVHVGTPCKVVIGATGRTIEAKVTREADRVESATRSMMTEVDIDNADNGIVPGMYASATLTIQQRANVLTLPVQAVSEEDKPTVWVVRSDGVIEERQVESGLKEGETVIFGSRGAFELGMKVSPKPISGNEGGGKG